MPKLYETENTQTEDKIVYLHYFRGGSDWYIVEKDTEPVQHQAFGYAILNGDLINAEWGDISIVELIQNNIELDFYWKRRTFKEVMSKGEKPEQSSKGFQKLSEAETKLQTPEAKIEYLKSLTFIESGESRIDDAYDSDDPEYNQRKVYVPIYYNLWHYADNTDPDRERFKNIHDAIADLSIPGNGEPDRYFSPVKETLLVLQEQWIDSNNKLIEDGDEILYSDFAFENKASDFVERFGDNPIIATDSFVPRETTAIKLLNQVYFGIHNDIVKSYEREGHVLKILTEKSGKYRTISVAKETGEDVGSIKLRIADHSYNPANNDADARSGNFISIEIANKNETAGRFRGNFGLQFTGDDSYEDVIATTNERILQIIDNWSIEIFETVLEIDKTVSKSDISVSKADYKNEFDLNKGIEALLDKKWNDKADQWSAEELEFIKGYTGYGGLDNESNKAGVKLDVKSLFEYFTPDQVIEKMWGLAYKYGYKDGPVLEPSCGIGPFFDRRFVSNTVVKYGYEINKYSARICKLLYPEAIINDGKEVKFFEEMFIVNNYTVRAKVTPKYKLVIGNPPYGTVGGLYMGMGEKTYTHANNFIDYFILRGLDLLEKDGLLIYIIGAETAGGGIPFLDQGMNKVKQMISERGKLIDAYRLPSGVFARTDVTSDIVVFRKR